MNTERARVTLDVLDEVALQQFAARLGSMLDGGLITLSGPLGAGKTSFCRGLLRGRGHSGAVKSPTYTLVESYRLPAGIVHHFDLYRLADPEELEFIGWRDYLTEDALCLVEWPERAADLLPPADISISIQYLAPGRRLTLWPHTRAGAEALAKTSDKS